MKNFNIKNKDNKISQGRGNSFKTEVRAWLPTLLSYLPTFGLKNRVQIMYSKYVHDFLYQVYEKEASSNYTFFVSRSKLIYKLCISLRRHKAMYFLTHYGCFLCFNSFELILGDTFDFVSPCDK